MNSKNFTEVVREEFGCQGYSVPPSTDDQDVVKYSFNTERMKKELGVSP